VTVLKNKTMKAYLVEAIEKAVERDKENIKKTLITSLNQHPIHPIVL